MQLDLYFRECQENEEDVKESESKTAFWRRLVEQIQDQKQKQKDKRSEMEAKLISDKNMAIQPKSQIEMRQVLMDDEQYFDVEEIEDDLKQEEAKQGQRVFKIDDEDALELNSLTDLQAKAELEPQALKQEQTQVKQEPGTKDRVVNQTNSAAKPDANNLEEDDDDYDKYLD